MCRWDSSGWGRSLCEDCGVSTPDVADALVDFFHRVFVSVSLGVEPLEVLNNLETLSQFFGHTEDGRVVRRPGAPDHPQFEPLRY